MEVSMLPKRLPERVIGEVFTGLAVLDAEYGTDRDYLETGGYSLIAETADDLPALNEIINTNIHAPEWATRIGRTGFVSALYIMNDDFSIMVYLPYEIASVPIKLELEE
jgi:hypothetical protein